MTEQPSRARAVAESFGVDPERYDRTRPAYPPAFLERLVAALPGRDVLDIGTGTGILARQLAGKGCRVWGVEPDERMAAFARMTGVAVDVATFEEWDPHGRTVDAVVAGTAWHWVDPDLGTAKAAQVLRPGGLLVPVWNVVFGESRVDQAFADAFAELVPEAPFRLPTGLTGTDAYARLLDLASTAIRAQAGFGEPERWEFAWDRTCTREEWLDLLPTSGALTRVDATRREVILDRVGAVIDALGGSFTATGSTLALVAVRG